MESSYSLVIFTGSKHNVKQCSPASKLRPTQKAISEVLNRGISYLRMNKRWRKKTVFWQVFFLCSKFSLYVSSGGSRLVQVWGAQPQLSYVVPQRGIGSKLSWVPAIDQRSRTIIDDHRTCRADDQRLSTDRINRHCVSLTINENCTDDQRL